MPSRWRSYESSTRRLRRQLQSRVKASLAMPFGGRAGSARASVLTNRRDDATRREAGRRRAEASLATPSGGRAGFARASVLTNRQDDATRREAARTLETSARRAAAR